MSDAVYNGELLQHIFLFVFLSLPHCLSFSPADIRAVMSETKRINSLKSFFGVFRVLVSQYAAECEGRDAAPDICVFLAVQIVSAKNVQDVITHAAFLGGTYTLQFSPHTHVEYIGNVFLQ